MFNEIVRSRPKNDFQKPGYFSARRPGVTRKVAVTCSRNQLLAYSARCWEVLLIVASSSVSKLVSLTSCRKHARSKGTTSEIRTRCPFFAISSLSRSLNYGPCIQVAAGARMSLEIWKLLLRVHRVAAGGFKELFKLHPDLDRTSSVRWCSNVAGSRKRFLNCTLVFIYRYFTVATVHYERNIYTYIYIFNEEGLGYLTVNYRRRALSAFEFFSAVRYRARFPLLEKEFPILLSCNYRSSW